MLIKNKSYKGVRIPKSSLDLALSLHNKFLGELVACMLGRYRVEGENYFSHKHLKIIDMDSDFNLEDESSYIANEKNHGKIIFSIVVNNHLPSYQGRFNPIDLQGLQDIIEWSLGLSETKKHENEDTVVVLRNTTHFYNFLNQFGAYDHFLAFMHFTGGIVINDFQLCDLIEDADTVSEKGLKDIEKALTPFARKHPERTLIVGFSFYNVHRRYVDSKLLNDSTD